MNESTIYLIGWGNVYAAVVVDDVLRCVLRAPPILRKFRDKPWHVLESWLLRKGAVIRPFCAGPQNGVEI